MIKNAVKLMVVLEIMTNLETGSVITPNFFGPAVAAASGRRLLLQNYPAARGRRYKCSRPARFLCRGLFPFPVNSNPRHKKHGVATKVLAHHCYAKTLYLPFFTRINVGAPTRVKVKL
ncbi:MAG: hypothetical protein KGM47_00910 [Acidobacteriota bacterium]|nr:hypothetical protein [Acidobacteriota bacterium]